MSRTFLGILALLLICSVGSARADFIGHGGMVRSVDISPDGNKVATGSFDYTARLWNFGDQSEIGVLDLHEGPVTSVTFSPDGKKLLTTSDDLTAIIWDVATLQPMHRLTGHGHKVMAGAFSPDGQRAATGSWDKMIRIWDVASGKKVAEMMAVGPVNALAFIDGGNKIVSGGHTPLIEIWDIAKQTLFAKLEGHLMGITALDVSPDGKQLLSASIDKSIRLWDLTSLSSIDKSIRLWDLTSLSEIRKIEVHENQVYDVSFSPDGKRALTAGKDGYVVDWNLGDGKPIHEIHAHDRIAWAARYTPDGRFAVSASSDEQARVWHLETGDRIGMTVAVDEGAHPWLESDHPGAKVFTKCAKCHALTADAPARSGPHFAGLFGRQAGSVKGYHYSAALTGVDFRWDEKTLFRLFDEGPDKMLPGTKMPIQKVTDDQQLTNLVDYLRVLTSKSN